MTNSFLLLTLPLGRIIHNVPFAPLRQWDPAVSPMLKGEGKSKPGVQHTDAHTKTWFPSGWTQAAQEHLISFSQRARWEQRCGLNQRDRPFIRRSERSNTTPIYLSIYVFRRLCSFFFFFSCNSSARSEKLWSFFLPSFLSFSFKPVWTIVNFLAVFFFFFLYFIFYFPITLWITYWAHTLTRRGTVWFRKKTSSSLVMESSRLQQAVCRKLKRGFLLSVSFFQAGLWLCYT